MKKSLTISFIILLLLLFTVMQIRPIVLAQSLPTLEEPWGPEIPPSEGPVGGNGMLLIGGPIQPGYGFVAYFEDKFGVRRTEIYEDEMPVILVITLPPGLRNSWASCIQYYPPNYVIRSYLFRNINLGPSGTYRLGPFYQAPGEPYGRYAFRIGIYSVDAAGNRYWDESIVFFEVKEKVVTITMTQTQEKTITQVITVTQTIERTLTAEKTLTQPIVVTIEKPVLMTIEKTVTQTTTATITVQPAEATTIPIIISILAVVIVALLGVYLMRMMKKK